MLTAACMANAEGSGWFFVYDGNGWATDETTEFKTTDKADVFVLSDYEVTADANKGGFNYQVTNGDWTKMYGWCAEADGNDVVGSVYKLGSVGNAWINCASGKYNITFNHADETILFEDADNAGIGNVAADSSAAEYFTLAGLRVDNPSAAPGLYIKRQGEKVSKIIIR